MNTETRNYCGELRTAAGSKGKKIVGYGAVFYKPSADLGGFIEYIRKGAFLDALKTSDARALFNHDTDTLPLGRQSAGTLLLKEDSHGLYYEITPPDTQGARDLMTSIERGDIRESSFAFTVERDEWTKVNGMTARIITKIKSILDISPVLYPAYPDTAVALRSLGQWRSTSPHYQEGNLNLIAEEDALYRKMKGIDNSSLAAEEDELFRKIKGIRR